LHVCVRGWGSIVIRRWVCRLAGPCGEVQRIAELKDWSEEKGSYF
jgi:hypothetical protein